MAELSRYQLHRLFPAYHKSCGLVEIDVNMFSIQYFLREANIFSVSSTVVLHVIKTCDNCLSVCVPSRQSARQHRKEMSFALYSDRYPSSQTACVCPHPGEGLSIQRGAWRPRRRETWQEAASHVCLWWSKFANTSSSDHQV